MPPRLTDAAVSAATGSFRDMLTHVPPVQALREQVIEGVASGGSAWGGRLLRVKITTECLRKSARACHGTSLPNRFQRRRDRLTQRGIEPSEYLLQRSYI